MSFALQFNIPQATFMHASGMTARRMICSSTFNKEREQSCFFGFDELCLAMERMEVIAVFRGHSVSVGIEDTVGSQVRSCF